MGFKIDDKGSHVAVTIEGFITVDQARSHFERLGSILRNQRERLGRAQVVVDTRGGQLQSAEVAALMSRGSAALYRDEDRVAMLLSSALLHLQIKRVTKGRTFPTFSAYNDAFKYLTS